MSTNISELAKEIAQHLEGWQAMEKDKDYTRYSEDNGWLAHESGAKVHLQHVWNNRERIEISGTYPRSSDGKCYPANDYRTKMPPRITCAIDRGAKAIAKDITKRFLRNYLSLYQWTQRQIAKYESDRANKTALMKRLGQVCGISADNDYRGNSRVYGNCGYVWVTIETYNLDTVEINLQHVPINLAERVCQLLWEA